MSVSTGFYRKNIGTSHQVVRIVLGLAAAGAAGMLLQAPMVYLGVGAGLAFAATGLVGYCPMCALAGVGGREGG